MMNGILRIQTYRPRQSAPVEGVTVVITGSGFTAHRITDAEGNAEDVAICAPACALSLDENNTTTLPYAVCSLTARKPGYRTVRIQGIQITVCCAAGDCLDGSFYFFQLCLDIA